MSARLSRRQALLRLGLAAGAMYCAPSTARISQARASSNPSPPSPPSPASKPSPPSPPTAPSPPSPPSGPSGAGQHNGDRSRRSGISRCSAPSGVEPATINRRDMDAALAAVSRGEARSVREIIATVQRTHPGRLLKVGFNTSGGTPAYWLRIVTPVGSVQTVTVEAASGRILGILGC